MHVFEISGVLVHMISDNEDPNAPLTIDNLKDVPPVRTQADLQRVWTALMGPLGFAASSLWLMFLDPDGRQTGLLPVIEDVPDHPTRQEARELACLCEPALRDFGPGSSVAVLRSRPGAHPPTAGDRAWAMHIAEVFAEWRLRTHPVHLATDQQLTALSADDLAA